MKNKTPKELCEIATNALNKLERVARAGRVLAAESGSSAHVIAADEFAASVITAHAKAVTACTAILSITPSFGGK